MEGDDFIVTMGLVEEGPSAMWVRLHDRAGTWWIDGNPHTHRGRMRAWNDADQRPIFFSLSDVEDASPLAWAWIAGFLAGSAPGPEIMFGLDYDDDRLRRWRRAEREYRRSGEWPHADWGVLIDFPEGVELPVNVWMHRGDEVWEWTGEWRKALSPAGRLDDDGRASVCDEHELEWVSSDALNAGDHDRKTSEPVRGGHQTVAMAGEPVAYAWILSSLVSRTHPFAMAVATMMRSAGSP